MAKKQAELGWNVMITGRNHEALEETKKKLKPLRAKLPVFKWMSVLILGQHKWLQKRYMCLGVLMHLLIMRPAILFARQKSSRPMDGKR